MLGATLVGYQVIQQRETVQKVPLAPLVMMEPFHHEHLPLDGIVGLIQQSAGHWHTGVFEYRLPTRFLGLDPWPTERVVGHPSRVRAVVRNMAQLLAKRTHAQAFALASPVKEHVPPRAARLADRGRDGGQFPGKLVDRMEEAVAQARPRKERAHALDSAVKTISEDASDPIGGLVTGRGALKLAIGLGQGRRTGLLGVAQMANHAATDNRREVHVVCQTLTVLFLSHEIRRQRQTTPCQHRNSTLLAEGADETIKGHGGDMADDRAPLQTEPSMHPEQGCFGCVRTHGAIAQDKVGEDREHRATRSTLDAPERHPRQTDTDRMRVARQTSSAATGGLVFQLKAEGEDESRHRCDKGLAVGKELKGGRLVLKIDGDGPVFAGLAGFVSQGSPLRSEGLNSSGPTMGVTLYRFKRIAVSFNQVVMAISRALLYSPPGQ